MNHDFKYGRTDADVPNFPDTNADGKFNLPPSGMTADESMVWFADEYDMNEREAVALLGGHTLGGVAAANNDVFVTGEDTWFNNKYYKIMLDMAVDYTHPHPTCGTCWEGKDANGEKVIIGQFLMKICNIRHNLFFYTGQHDASPRPGNIL